MKVIIATDSFKGYFLSKRKIKDIFFCISFNYM